MSKAFAAGALLAVALISGCAQTEKRPYQDPTSGATAFVIFRNDSPGRANVAVYDDAARCSGRRFLPDLLVGEQNTIRVRAGEPFAFTFRYAVPNTTPQRYCSVTATFDPQAEARYLVSMRQTGDSCTTEVGQVELGADGRLRPIGGVKVIQRLPAKEPADESGPFCLPVP